MSTLHAPTLLQGSGVTLCRLEAAARFEAPGTTGGLICADAASSISSTEVAKTIVRIIGSPHFSGGPRGSRLDDESFRRNASSGHSGSSPTPVRDCTSGSQVAKLGRWGT